MAFPVSSPPLDLRPVITSQRTGRMPALPARSPPLGPRVLAPPPPRTAQRDSCVQSGTTYNSRRFRRETSAWSAAPLRSLSSPRRPAAFGSPPEPLGRRIVLGGALRPGNGGQRSPVGAARRRRGGSAPGPGGGRARRVPAPARPQQLRARPATEPPAAKARRREARRPCAFQESLRPSSGLPRCRG